MFGTSGTGSKALRAAAAAAAGLALFVTAACGSSSTKTNGSGPSKAPSSSPTASAAPATFAPPSSPGKGKLFYVSIGDSYGAGYQPASNGKGLGTFGEGYANQLPALVDSHGYHLTLVNFSCSGATTTSLISTKSCPYAGEQGPGQVTYPDQTQAAAATAFIAAHRSEVGLITVSISGNDITACARQKDTTAAGVATCLTGALAKVKANLATFLKQLHTAAGSDIPIIGLTYPDVVLGSYVSAKASTRPLAALSVTAFRSLINPALKAQYDAGERHLPRHHRGHRRLHPLHADDHACPVRHHPGRRGQGVRADLLLPADEHPSPDHRLYLHRPADRCGAAA